jgi:hypothetical protein
MLAAFCFGDRLMSQASGRAKGVSGTDDPKFAALVRGVTHALFPQIDHKRSGDGGADVIP